MKEIEVADYAQRLYAAHGDKAEAEAAQRELAARDNNKADEAEDWVRIRKAIHELRG